MNDDERAIREVIDTWLAASAAGDTAKVLSLMADDVVFMVVGREPFGKKEFAASAQAMEGVAMQAKSEVLEIRVLDGWAFCRSHLRVTMTPPEGEPVRRAGYVLTLFRKEASGAWLLARDANMLTKE
jgi:uncharacterized protein (TIGR02246 family)